MAFRPQTPTQNTLWEGSKGALGPNLGQNKKSKDIWKRNIQSIGIHGNGIIYLHFFVDFVVNVGKYNIHGSSGYSVSCVCVHDAIFPQAEAKTETYMKLLWRETPEFDPTNRSAIITLSQSLVYQIPPWMYEVGHIISLVTPRKKNGSITSHTIVFQISAEKVIWARYLEA